ncbi:hypothetical protein AMTRI_Chr09g17500 [Amborella trichopoda]
MAQTENIWRRSRDSELYQNAWSWVQLDQLYMTILSSDTPHYLPYDLALLFQPMLMLGISIGVALNVIFTDWMVTILLSILFIVTSTKAFMRGVETWKKETILKKEATKLLESSKSNGCEEVECTPL